MNDYNCNLCSMGFDDNKLINQQLSRHESWHLHCKINGRNTVEGIVKWIKYCDPCKCGRCVNCLVDSSIESECHYDVETQYNDMTDGNTNNCDECGYMI